ncbi:precorrin-6A reductase [Paenibacillus sp. y28]|uniref:precorrin-6A reductase n=1 Tax=Paenibacillus sp. y28 TaxID=3129110 RepID=UPI0030195E5D
MSDRAILQLAGTSDARALALELKQAGWEPLCTVVTESAAHSLEEAGLNHQIGRMTAEQMAELVRSKGLKAIVDASHPFAEEASRNAIAAAEAAGVPYVRYERDSLSFEANPLVTFVDDYEQAAELAAGKGGVIMLTTGSKTLQIFTERLLGLPDTTLIARMLPRRDNMEKCEQLGVPQKHIVAMQGPFSAELNTALYRQYGVTLMITKESGQVGAVDEKVTTALALGIETIIIGRPQVAYGTVCNDFGSVQQSLTAALSGA